MTVKWKLAGLVSAAMLMAACQTNQEGTNTNSASDAGTGATSDTGGGTGTSAGGTGSIPALVSVNLQNVLNDLSVSLQVDRNSIPVTAQVPVAVAASVCGVSVDVIAASAANGHASCTATTTSPQLTQVVQQQISTGGNLGGGSQTTTTPPPPGS